jgi:hypothetical protein
MPVNILGIPFSTPNVKTALDRAIEKDKDGVALVDGVILEKGWTAILFGRWGYKVEGTILKDNSKE